MARFETKIKEGSGAFLDAGEEVLAAVVARPRGWTMQNASPGGGFAAGMVGGALGGKKQQQNTDAATEAGFTLGSPMALAVTQKRLLSIDIAAPIGLGMGGKVKGLLDSAPLAEVGSIEVRGLAVGKTITVTVRGTPFTLEVGAGANAGGVAEAFKSARATPT